MEDPMNVKALRTPRLSNEAGAILHAHCRRNPPMRSERTKISTFDFDRQHLTLHPNNTFVLFTLLIPKALFQTSEPRSRTAIEKSYPRTNPL